MSVYTRWGAENLSGYYCGKLGEEGDSGPYL